MKINNIDINYVQYGNKKKQDVILLHGWGQNIGMMDHIGKKIEKNYHITNIDLPGFGKSEEPNSAFTIYDYADIIIELLKKLKIKKPILIGHSFGGSVSIVVSSKIEVEKLVLMGAPFIRKDRRYTVKARTFRLLKKILFLRNLENFVKNLIGSEDYKKSSKVMREILVNIVNEDITKNLLSIESPTLLIWGSNDMSVSVSDARFAEKEMKDAGLVVFKNAGHYAYLERLNQTISVINNFLGGK